MQLHENPYFPKFEFLFAHDPEKVCKTGDIVLIEKLPERLTRLITHKVKKVVYPLGDVTDPLTNRKVSFIDFRDHLDAVHEFYGKSPNAFDYEQAPKRGWLEDKKDFTHVETYIKYNELDGDDPYAV